ncbi:MAG: hypothetical protein R3C11_16490 [Planctomycetaceae bacterium]
MATVGDLQEILIQKKEYLTQLDKTELARKTFYRYFEIRNLVREVTGQTTLRLKPSTDLRPIVHRTMRPRLWSRLKHAWCQKLPVLELDGEFVAVFLLLGPFVWLGLLMETLRPLQAPSTWFCALTLIYPLLMILVWFLMAPLFRKSFPLKLETIGGIVTWKLNADGTPWLKNSRLDNYSDDSIRDMVLTIVAEYAEVPREQVHSESRLIEDLFIDELMFG